MPSGIRSPSGPRATFCSRPLRSASTSVTVDGWNLKLPEEWSKEKLAAERTVGADESAVSFYRVGADGSRKKVLTIYRLTGSMREELAGIGDRFTLTRQVEAVYAAEIGDTWNMQLTEQSLRDRFSLIMAEWTMGDN